ncbi:hypothetical protein FJ414_28240 [Mesorhizobium sp. B3-1-6]|uniref:hypothetical protein n=1 Tax=Mesorhizobium sp. B3-1-6 TaxID=2589895 RepID=UPI001129452E|nr:hypothetical protein [Mesorhizobium sp. B3-1-6]TPI27878.1 hypothetical protein FJ414_28240 [Mesorhizobium sp. B3-1-6]
MLEAIEAAAAIHASMNLFERKFAARGRTIPGLGTGAIWQERLGIWGHFSESGRRTPPDKYWNVFGQQPVRLRQNMLVEINPPGSGKNLNRQGVLARDDRRHRWLLHQGRLHPRGIRITEDMFDSVATKRRVKVRYADGAVAACHPVTDLDQSSDQVQIDLAQFVDLCARVRVHYQLGDAARRMFERINAAEASSSPERQGAYSLPPLPARKAERRHADIWHALAKELDALGVEYANSRFGRYGPDLFAQTPKDSLLFEIKADASASDIQRALGQLQLYEHLSGQVCRKIMVLPEAPPAPIVQALSVLGIELLHFERHSNSVRLDRTALRKMIGSPAGKAKGDKGDARS